MAAEMDALAVPSAIDPETSQETMDILYEISRILNTGLDRNTLAILVGLCEAGVNPEALAAVVKELRREGQALDVRAPARLPPARIAALRRR